MFGRREENGAVAGSVAIDVGAMEARFGTAPEIEGNGHGVPMRWLQRLYLFY
jgi:hypothetical protein